jgi:DNA-binding transcriptional regulator YiaG
MTGQQFKDAREAKGYSRTEIAAYLGRHRNTVRYWETGRTPVPKFASDWLRNAEAKKVSA